MSFCCGLALNDFAEWLYLAHMPGSAQAVPVTAGGGTDTAARSQRANIRLARWVACSICSWWSITSYYQWLEPAEGDVYAAGRTTLLHAGVGSG